MLQERRVPCVHPIVEPRQTALGVRSIDIDQPPVGKLGRDHPALAIVLGHADSEHNVDRLFPENHGRSRIALLLGRIPDGFAALGPGDILHVGFLAFDLLKTKDIGLRRLYRLDQALFQD